jgi:hypothetical protein
MLITVQDRSDAMVLLDEQDHRGDAEREEDERDIGRNGERRRQRRGVGIKLSTECVEPPCK